MSYVDLNTIHNPSTGTIPPASWGDQIRDNLEFLIDPPAVSVYHNTPQNIPDATLTVMSANSENFDNDSMHSTSVNTSRITIQTAGRYLLIATAIFASGATGERNVQFLVNGSAAVQGSKIQTNESGSQTSVVTAVRAYVFSAGDYVEVRTRHRQGSALDVTLDEFFAYFITR